MTGTYNVWLQLLSFIVAVIASYVALDMASRVSSSTEKSAKYWLIGGAVAMGTGIWSMHFIGMLAFNLPIQMGYDVTITLASMLIAILASGFALFTINRNVLTLKRLSVSGLVMGFGIASMHYVGMDAMRMSPPIRYDTTLYVLSIVIAIAASIAALWITFHLRSDSVANVSIKRIGAAVVMGIAIVGMHYTGMAAANFAPDSICLGNPQQIGSLWMAITIAGCTLLFLAATMAISVFDARLASSTARLVKSVIAANDSLKEEIEVRREAEDALQRTNAELLEMKMAAEAANQAKSEFLANVSHELRTPLTLILAPLEQLLASQGQPEDWRSRIERVQRNALLLLNRVNDILDFSKAEADKFDVRWEAMNLCELLPQLVGDVAPVAQNKNCSLDCHVDPALEAVALDRSHFEKIFLNLLGNALKFTPSGGWIRVEASAIDAEVFELAVTDSGIGIAADKLPLLFNRFQQVDNSATRAYGGTGIGLALVRQLAELMGGTVGVESEAGKGSRFFVRLPLGKERLEKLGGNSGSASAPGPTPAEVMLRRARFREGQVEAHGTPDSAAGPDGAARPTVLVADDNPDMLAYVTELLAAECNVMTAVNGEEAWSLLRQQHVDVLLSDVMMPELDGFGLTERVKKSPDFSHIPVILVTARGGSDASAHGLDVGADDYIAKPFSPQELMARVRAALRMAHTQAQLREKSREAGMAMVATGILHNLGNILNGVTVTSGVIQEKLHHSKIPKLQKVAQLLQDHINDLPSFIASDSRGKVLPAYIDELSSHLEAELRSLIKEVDALRACTDHVAGMISIQQQFASPHRELREIISANTLMERAYKLSVSTFEMHGVEVACEFDCADSLMADSHKVLQILLNLLGNARHAVRGRGTEGKIRLRTWSDGDMVKMEVTDNGVGIEAAHLPLIFNQGFTTKKDGHGVGLHSSANWAREMGGALACHSDGPGKGATFILTLPGAAQAAEETKSVAAS